MTVPDGHEILFKSLVHPGVNHILQTDHIDITDIRFEHIRFLFTEILINISIYSPTPCCLDDLKSNMTNGIQTIAKKSMAKCGFVELQNRIMIYGEDAGIC